MKDATIPVPTNPGFMPHPGPRVSALKQMARPCHHRGMADRADGWRVEADDEWLAAHSSDNLARLRRRLSAFGRFNDAISQAELGPLGGAPRNPKLKIGGKAYSVVRHAERWISYTVITVSLETCRRCRGRLAEAHRLTRVDHRGGREVVGTVRMCRRCQADAWLFFSRMPATTRARRRARKVVL
jgi:hypothetical protein